MSINMQNVMQSVTEGEPDHFNQAVVGNPQNRIARVLPAMHRAAMALVNDPASAYRANSLDSKDVNPLESISPQLSAEFVQMASDFAATRFSSYVGSRQSGGKFALYDAEADGSDPAKLQREQQLQPLAPGAKPAILDDVVNYGTYNVDVRSGARPVPDQSRANEDAGGQLMGRAMRFLMEAGLRDLEHRLFDEVGAKSDWGLSIDGHASARSTNFDPANDANNNAIRWTVANSTPIADVLAGVRAVAKASNGKRANVLLLSPNGWNALLTHPDITARIVGGATTTGPALVTAQVLATIFGLDRVAVSWVVDDKGEFLFGNNAILAYVPMTKGMNDPSAVIRVGWTGFMGSAADGTSVRTVRDELGSADIVQATTAWDIKQQGRSLGCFLSNIV